MRRLLQAAQANSDKPVYLVGGAVRDALLGRPVADVDVAALGSAKALAARLAQALSGRLVVLDEATRTYRIVLKDRRQVDVAQCVGKTIDHDLTRRDFTINAMAADLEGNLLDPFGGRADLRRKLVRATSPKVLTQDPLRLLRAFRFAAQLDFKIDAPTLRLIAEHRRAIAKPAGERVREELLRVCACARAHKFFRLMDEAGLLTQIFPELEAARRCAVVYYGEGGVMRHTLDALERMDYLLERLEPAFGRNAEQALREVSPPILRLGVLLHDVAKAPTAKKIGGRLRFFEHDQVGAKMAGEMLRRLRFSRDEIDTISAYVRYHLRPGNLAANATISDKAVFRFFQEMGSRGVGQLLVCWADHASYLSLAALKSIEPKLNEDPRTFPISNIRAPETRKTLHHLQVIHYLLRCYFERKDSIEPPRVVDGHDVMRALRVKPGPDIGKALKIVKEAQVEGKVTDRISALKYLKQIWYHR